jgi:hypothetical protein
MSLKFKPGSKSIKAIQGYASLVKPFPREKIFYLCFICPLRGTKAGPLRLCASVTISVRGIRGFHQPSRDEDGKEVAPLPFLRQTMAWPESAITIN